jgi:hypothetical protein
MTERGRPSDYNRKLVEDEWSTRLSESLLRPETTASFVLSKELHFEGRSSSPARVLSTTSR